MNWSIRSKFLAVMCTLLMLCLGVYLLMAVSVFKTDKTQLVFDLNRSQVSNLTSELETQFTGVSEKLKLFALLPPNLQLKMAPDLLSEDSEITAVSIFETGNGLPERTFYQDRFLETYGLDKSFFEHVVKKIPIPFHEILAHGDDVWNASIDEGPPLMGYGRLVVQQDEHGVPVRQWAVVGFVKLDRFLQSVSLVHLSDVYVANRRGEVLVAADAKSLLQHPTVVTQSLFQEALRMKTKVEVVNRKVKNESYLAGLAKGFNDQFYVVAKASENKVFQVVRDISIRTLLFGSIVLTFVILAAFLISRSLTENIAVLVDGMESVAKGDLTTQIHLKGRDETVSLANSFNQMITDLKESRDALEDMNRDLDQKVKDRTAQLEEQNKKIKEVQEALLRTTRLASIGEIAGRTAHEVLNPLTILLTRAGLVQKKIETGAGDLRLLDEMREAWGKDYDGGGFDRLIQNWQTGSRVFEQKNLWEEDLENLKLVSEQLHSHKSELTADLKFIRDEANRIGKIINGMRRLGQLNSDSREYSIHDIIRDCRDLMNDLFVQRDFTIECDLRATPDLCRVDRDELIQALTNLMRNSLQALAGDGAAAKGRLILRTQSSGGRLTIEVEDNGIGISKEFQNQLFESKFTTKSRDEGTGLGLSIARRFIRAVGGDIEFVTSSPGEKTIFRIDLPLSGQDAKQGAAA